MKEVERDLQEHIQRLVQLRTSVFVFSEFYLFALFVSKHSPHSTLMYCLRFRTVNVLSQPNSMPFCVSPSVLINKQIAN